MNIFSWLNYLSVKQKMLLLLVFIFSTFIFMSAYTVITLDHQKQDNMIINIAARQAMLSQKYNTEFSLALQQAKTTGEEIDYKGMNKSQDLFEKSSTALSQGGTTYLDTEMTNRVEIPIENDPAIQAKLSEVTQQWLQIKEVIKTIDPLTYQLVQLSHLNTLSNKLLSNMEQTVVMLEQRSADRVTTMLGYQKLSWAILIVSSLFLIRLLSRNITQPLQEIAATTQRFSQGNLKYHSYNTKHRDELGTVAFHTDKMRYELNKMVHNIKQNSKQVFLSSEQLAVISAEISTVNAKQKDDSKSLIKATNSLLEITESVNKKISETDTTAKETQTVATKCVNVMENGLTGLENTVSSVESTVTQVGSLKTITTQIHDVIKTIESNAAKTNLLAINATTEAARAGEHGRNFAMVAEEVHPLASQAANSSSQLAALINQLTNQIDNSVETMDSAVEKTNQFQENLIQTVTTFKSIEDDIIKNNKNSAEIVRLNLQQNEYLPTLKSELENLCDIIEFNSNKTNSMSLVSSELHKVAKRLDTLLDQFETDSVTAKKRKGNEQRQYPRIKNQVKVVLEQAGEMFEGITQDLSMTGLQIKCLKDINIDLKTPINFHIYLPTQEKEEQFVLPGNVIHSKSHNDDFYYGVKLNSLNETENNNLQTIFNYFQKESEYKTA